MLRESDSAKRCLLPLKPPLLRHSCPKQLLGKRDSGTRIWNLPRGRTAVGRLAAGVWRPGEGSASVVSRGTGSVTRDGAWAALVLWGELIGRRWNWAPRERTAGRGARGRPFKEQLEWKTFPQAEQAFPAYLQVLELRQTRVHIVPEEARVLVSRIAVLYRVGPPLLSLLLIKYGLLMVSKVLVKLFPDLLVP